jgi:glycosyltransferase involved in cell wall biosynthesis
MLRAAVFNTQFLPYSQTFVYEELKQHRRYAAEVFARVRMLPERFAYPEVHVAGPLYGYTRTDRGFDRLFRERRYDVVHAHFGTGAVYALRWAERFGLPLVVTFHGHDVTRLLSYERFLPAHLRYAALSQRLFSRMTLGLCASAELSELLVGLGVEVDKLRVHRLGIDLDGFRAGRRDPSRPQIAMVGRFVPKKGFAHGLRAFAEVARAHPTARLVVVGDGELDRSLRALTRKLSVQDRVTFPGALARATSLRAWRRRGRAMRVGRCSRARLRRKAHGSWPSRMRPS